MKKFGLIGHPIAHSLSPALFKAAYHGKYSYDLIEEEEFEKAYEIFMNEYDGINVTAPFKESAFRKADTIMEECQATGAANLLIKTEGRVSAYNSDFSGLRKWLTEISGRFPGQDRLKVLIAGYGGAGKAAAAAAESLKMSVTIINRTLKSEEMKPLEEFHKEFIESDIIIYNIPAPIEGLQTLSNSTAPSGTTKTRVILEANYRNPSFTPELQKSISQAYPGTEFVDGKVWLLYQAVTGYEIFTGETPDLEEMRKVI